MLSELGASPSNNSGLVSSSTEPHLNRAWSGSPVERTKWSQTVRFGADRGDGAAPLSCEVTWLIHGARARLWVPPHLKSDTLCRKRWPCSLLMLIRALRRISFSLSSPPATPCACTKHDGDTAAATAPTTCGGISDISSTGTGRAHARRLSSDTTPRPKTGQEASLTPPWHPARAPCNRRSRTFHDTRARRRESRSAHATAAAAAATEQHRAQARRPARRVHRARSHSTAAEAAPPSSRHQTPRTNDDARRRKDAACPHGHKAEDVDRWGKRKLGSRPGNGAPLRVRTTFFFLPCERGLNSHTVVITRPRLSLAL